jgi:hypothetical protein
MPHHEPTPSRYEMRTGLFPDRATAERAYAGLRSRGYGQDDINVLMTDEARRRWYPSEEAGTELGSKALEGAGVGAAAGGTLGAVLAAVAATTASIAVPGIGLVVAGPVAAALAGAGAGGVAGGLLGALIGAGIPEERAREYEHGLQQGGMVMGVTPRSEDDVAYLDREWSGSGRTEQARRLAS